MTHLTIDATLRVLRGDQDQDYRAARASEDQTRSRVLMGYVGIVYPLFYGLDLLVYPEHALAFGLLRASAFAAAFVLFAVTDRRPMRPYVRHAAIGLALYATAAVSWMCGRTMEGFETIYVVGVIVCFIAIATVEVFRPLELLVVLSGLSIAHVLVVGGMGHGFGSPAIYAVSAFLSGATLFCTTSAVLLEWQRQRLFTVNRELERRHTELEMAHAHQAKFFSTVSHELRSPINSVLGFSALVLEREPSLHPKSERNLHLIASSAERLLCLVNDLLDLSKMEAGRLELIEQTFDLSETVREVGEATQPLLGSKAVEIRVHVLPTCVVCSDEARIRQVLTNLASNAVRFTEAGHIEIRLDYTAQGGVVLAVEDTGMGIPEHARATIFEAFKQAHLHTNSGGTGLGLSIVSSLVEVLHGQVELTSEVGVGSTFQITLPGIVQVEAA